MADTLANPSIPSTAASDGPPKRGPGRPPKADAQSTSDKGAKIEPPKPKTTNVTYVPRDGDPATTTFHGHVFKANKPLPVSHALLLAQAKSNPWFEVEGHDPAKPAADDEGVPSDAEHYRRYAVAYFKNTDWYTRKPNPEATEPGPNSQELKDRWNSEEELRETLGVGTADIEYLDKLLTPRLAELERAEK